ncbi:hypothetical protein [Commensalibacter nepenthis]|uniref:Uncharacterized protein n=1 Tax=Commensalibacter nepenthis TaxID=3043872 RepID=A0ABT6Q8J8_9PROT|nr:hypothetical protein [Commensalibacter sp. TBRC 10068]MDI2113228.1 hypothetical protein [Commensalibacter sp. TBRC 10068]
MVEEWFWFIFLIFVVIFVGLLIRLSFSRYKKIIFLALVMIPAGLILFCVGIFQTVAAILSVGHSNVHYNPTLYLSLGLVSLILVIPCAIIGFFEIKKASKNILRPDNHPSNSLFEFN